LLLLPLLATISTVGCKVQFASTPSKDKTCNELDIEGEYEILEFPFQNKDAGVSKGKVKITKSDNMNFPYSITLNLGGSKKENFICQTYRIGKLDLAFVKFKSNNAPTKNWFAFLIKVVKNKIEATPVDIAFFFKNPKKLSRKHSSDDKKIVIDSEAKKLDSFFESHQKSSSLFDHNNQLILKRTDKK